MNTPLKTIIIGNTIKALTFSTFVPFLLLTSCKKSSNSSVAPNNSVAANPASRMTGVWAMRGTHEYLAHGITDIINTTVTLWLADDTTIVAFSNGTIYPGYSVYKFNLGSDSIYVFGDYACNVKKDSLQYHIFYPSSGNYQIVSLQSISHTPFANSTISASTAKMVGRKQWHGTYRTNYVHPWYTGLPDVDTTYYDPLTIQINALSDTLIMAKFFYSGSNDVWQYLFFRKTYDDQSTTIFTCTDNPYHSRSITYYAANNSMFYFDSSDGVIPSVYKYYTP